MTAGSPSSEKSTTSPQSSSKTSRTPAPLRSFKPQEPTSPTGSTATAASPESGSTARPDRGSSTVRGAEGEVKWWKDSKNIIGKLTKKSKRIKIMNMINDHCTILQVPGEETIRQILNRYLKYNKHGASYVWKRLGRPLDMHKTLEENGIEDEDPQFDRLDVVHANWYIPVIHLFFSDDLTVA